MVRSLLTSVVLSAFSFGCIIITSDDTGGSDTDVDEDAGRPPPGGLDDSGGNLCEIGSEGCNCTTGGKCNDPFFCNTNLNICVADLCPVGTEACACTPQGACDPGLTCASDFCVDLGCTVGAEACPCTEGGACDPGLVCLSGYCVDPGTGSSG